VDDSDFNQEALKRLLSTFGVKCDFAYHGQQAIEKITQDPAFTGSKKKPYDIIFMDCDMPVMDGYTATSILKEKMKSQEIMSIPIIACTALSTQVHIEECLSCGMDDFVMKPLSKNALRLCLLKWAALYKDDL
jgi:CheY-like chemotaxis protein